MDFVAQRVKQITCGQCGKAIDPATVKPLSTAECPHCHAKLNVPASFGDFLLIEILGHGTAGIVCKALDEKLHRQVAVKILRSGEDSRELVEACQNEARALAALNHPNVVQVHSIGEYRGQPYIVMELIDGGCVEKVMLKEPADEKRSLDIAIDAAEGLQAAHGVGLVHMDVKPGNILFDRNGRAKLIDFGVARAARKSSDEIVGTPYYVAPEVVRGKPATHQADIYSLGATLFHMLAARPPFVGTQATSVITARLKKSAPNLVELRDNLHPQTIEVVAQMLATDTDDRYANYEDLIEDLRAARLAADAPRVESATDELAIARTTPRRSSIASRKTKKGNGTLIMSAVVIVTLLLVAGVILFVVAQNRASRQTASNATPPGDSSSHLDNASSAAPYDAVALAQQEAASAPSAPPPKLSPAPNDSAKPTPPNDQAAPTPKPEMKVPEPKSLADDKTTHPAEIKPATPKPEPESNASPSKPEPAKTTPKPKPTAPKTPPPAAPTHVTFTSLYQGHEKTLADNGGWNVLSIAAVESNPGLTATRHDDGSILFDGAPSNELQTYTVTLHTTLAHITGFRFDALTDAKRSDGGVAMSPAKQIVVMTKLTATAVAPDAPIPSPSPVAFNKATASSHTKGWEAHRLIDKDPKYGWATAHPTHDAQHLVVACASPVGDGSAANITFTITFRTGGEAIHHLRISATTAADPLAVKSEPQLRPTKDQIAFVPLEPTSVASADDAKMSVLDDHSVLVAADHVSTDTYTVIAETNLSHITAVRLDALPDDSLRDKGPGTGVHGRFTLSEFELEVAPRSNPSQREVVKFARAVADDAAAHHPIEAAIDGVARTTWFVNDHPGEKRTAVFIPAEPIAAAAGGSILTFTLRQQRLNLGRFRLDVTTAPKIDALLPKASADKAPAEKKPETVAAAKPVQKKPQPKATSPVEHYLNLGSELKDNGTTWAAAPKSNGNSDGYVGGHLETNKSIADPLAQSCVTGISHFRLHLPNGRYAVVLLFAEINEKVFAGGRRFSVTAQGQAIPEWANIDPYQNAHPIGLGRISHQEAVVTVTKGVLDLEFHQSDKKSATPLLSAIAVRSIR